MPGPCQTRLGQQGTALNTPVASVTLQVKAQTTFPKEVEFFHHHRIIGALLLGVEVAMINRDRWS